MGEVPEWLYTYSDLIASTATLVGAFLGVLILACIQHAQRRRILRAVRDRGRVVRVVDGRVVSRGSGEPANG